MSLRRLLRLPWDPRRLAIALALAFVALVVLAAIVAPRPDHPATTVTGKHHLPSHRECTTDGCGWTSPVWQLDLLDGRRANTITVDRETYERYRVGDYYDD